MDVCYHGKSNIVYQDHNIIKRESKVVDTNKICK
jgi:hypothetical protein